MQGKRVILEDLGLADIPEAAGMWRNGDDVMVKDPTGGARVIGAGSGATDHGALEGLADDDHGQYLNAARHVSAHDATVNNALAVTGDVNGKATLGAHVADAAVHWVRPAKVFDVATDGTGQYATIGAALTAANAVAGAAAPVAVRVFPGVYAEQNLTIGAYVTLMAAVPGQAVIKPVTTSGKVITFAGSGVMRGLVLDLPSLTDHVVYLPTVAATVKVIDCEIYAPTMNSIKAVFYHATSGSVDVEMLNCRFEHTGRLIQDTADMSSGYLVHGCRWTWTAGSLTDYKAVTINTSNRVVLRGCQIRADADSATQSSWGLIRIQGTSTTIGLIDSCEIKTEVGAGSTLTVIESAGSETLRVRNVHIVHVVEDGDAYDLSAGTGSVIETASSVWDPATQTGAGTIRQLVEGDVAARNVTVSGAISVAGFAEGKVAVADAAGVLGPLDLATVALLLSGGTMAGDINMNGNSLTNVNVICGALNASYIISDTTGAGIFDSGNNPCPWTCSALVSPKVLSDTGLIIRNAADDATGNLYCAVLAPGALGALTLTLGVAGQSQPVVIPAGGSLTTPNILGITQVGKASSSTGIFEFYRSDSAARQGRILSVDAGQFNIWGEMWLALGGSSGTDILCKGTSGVEIAKKMLLTSGVGKITPGAAPGSPSEGDFYFDSTTHKLRVHNGTDWQDCW